MANHKSAKKRIKTDNKKRIRNHHYKSQMRTMIKKIRSTTDVEAARNFLRDTVSLLDKLVLKGMIHKNLASRNKSRLTKLVNSLS